MDAEGLNTGLWLLVTVGAIFFMMRYGCGAHMMHGHRHGHAGGGHEDRPEGGSRKDPVCGMAVDTANAAGAAVRDGHTYYFCSSNCRDTFEQAPEKYVDAAAASGGHR